MKKRITLRGPPLSPEQVAKDMGLSRKEQSLILAQVEKVLRGIPPRAKRAPALHRLNGSGSKRSLGT